MVCVRTAASLFPFEKKNTKIQNASRSTRGQKTSLSGLSVWRFLTDHDSASNEFWVLSRLFSPAEHFSIVVTKSSKAQPLAAASATTCSWSAFIVASPEMPTWILKWPSSEKATSVSRQKGQTKKKSSCQCVCCVWPVEAAPALGFATDNDSVLAHADIQHTQQTRQRFTERRLNNPTCGTHLIKLSLILVSSLKMIRYFRIEIQEKGGDRAHDRATHRNRAAKHTSAVTTTHRGWKNGMGTPKGLMHFLVWL